MKTFLPSIFAIFAIHVINQNNGMELKERVRKLEQEMSESKVSFEHNTNTSFLQNLSINVSVEATHGNHD